MIPAAKEREYGAIRRTGAGRADLIEFLARAGTEGLRNMACFAGFAPPEEKKKNRLPPLSPLSRARERSSRGHT